MDRKEAARILDETPIRVLGITETLTYLEALEMGVEALQEPEIVHCKDCRHWDKEIMYCNHTGIQIEPDGYCVYGERKE